MSRPGREPEGQARGADAATERRPGVPEEPEPRAAAGAPRPLAPQPGAWQRAAVKATPVFGTAAPLRGISGTLRRAAYRVPEHRARHWMLLLLADRVDVVESAARERPGAAAAVAAAGVAVVAALVARGRARR